jgi:predicted DNA-binding transcriptional regulator YafY
MSKHGTVERCMGIVRQLQLNAKVKTDTLAELFEVTDRTIQKDLNERLRAFPICTDGQGYYWLDESRLDRASLLNEDEEIVLMLALELLEESDNISRYSRSIMQKMLDTRSVNPFYIKQEELEPIDIDSVIVDALEAAIEARRYATIATEGKRLRLAPLKIVNFDGIWYLFARDERDGRIRTWLLRDIRDVRPEQETHELSHEQIERMLERTHTAWFEDGGNFEVRVKVHPEIAEYFRLRRFLNSQEIAEEYDDGSLLVSFDVTTDEDVDNLIKSWLPHIEVVSPERFRKRVLDELEGYVARLRGA